MRASAPALTIWSSRPLPELFPRPGLLFPLPPCFAPVLSLILASPSSSPFLQHLLGSVPHPPASPDSQTVLLDAHTSLCSPSPSQEVPGPSVSCQEMFAEPAPDAHGLRTRKIGLSPASPRLSFAVSPLTLWKMETFQSRGRGSKGQRARTLSLAWQLPSMPLGSQTAIERAS